MHASALIYLLPLLSPLSASALALSNPRSRADAGSLEARELYDRTNAQIRDAHSLHARKARAEARSPVAFAGQARAGHGKGARSLKKKKVKRSCAASGSDSATTTLLAAAAIATDVSTTSADSDDSDDSDSSTASSSTASSTSAATASATSSTSSSSSSSSSSNSTSSLFPWGTGSAYWTTSTDFDDNLSFNGALKPLSSGKLPSSGDAPDGSSALIASYPSGTYGLTSAGYSFYTEGEHDNVDVTSASEVSFSYSVWFEEGFEFNQGGKMPGLYGGTSLSEAKSCSGGRQEGRDSCFSARLMWRPNGAGEIYDYLPVQYTGTDDGYGESIDRGAYTWATGRWQTVAIRVKLNDAGSANGEQELYVDGESKISLTGVTFSTDSSTKIYGIMAQTFFGGHTSDWASPQDQSAYFKDWSLAILA